MKSLSFQYCSEMVFSQTKIVCSTVPLYFPSNNGFKCFRAGVSFLTGQWQFSWWFWKKSLNLLQPICYLVWIESIRSDVIHCGHQRFRSILTKLRNTLQTDILLHTKCSLKSRQKWNVTRFRQTHSAELRIIVFLFGCRFNRLRIINCSYQYTRPIRRYSSVGHRHDSVIDCIAIHRHN